MRQLIFILISVVILTGCGKGTVKKDDAPPASNKPVLLSPAQNEICEQGKVISATSSSVTLKWNAVSNANSYEINIKNLTDGSVITQTVNATQLDVALTRNAPYSWSVTSKATAGGATAKSDTWKFYNSGPATISYAPFPAEIVAPAMNQIVAIVNGKITLSWNGSDVDNDIVSYDVYLSDSPTPTLLRSNVTVNSITDVVVTGGTKYYWKVVTRDGKVNTSDSGVYKFSTQ